MAKQSSASLSLCFSVSLFLCLFVACSGARGRVVAEVEGEPIYAGEFARALKYEYSKYDPQITGDPARALKIKQDVLETLITDTLQYVLAKKAGVSVTEDELAEEYKRYKSQYTEPSFQKMLEIKGMKYEEWKEKRKRSLLVDKLIEKEVISKIVITDEDVQRYYKGHIKEFRRGEEVHARQILVDEQKLADELRGRALKGENFAALAQEYSIAPEGKRGGDLSWFPRGIMPPAFDRVCFSLPAGEVSQVVKTEFGYHIFKVIEKRPPQTLQLKDVRDKITARLRQDRIEQVFKDWFEPLRKDAKVKINKEIFDAN